MGQRTIPSANISVTPERRLPDLDLGNLPGTGLLVAQGPAQSLDPSSPLAPAQTSSRAQALETRFSATDIQNMVTRAMYLWHGTNLSQAIASQLQVEFKLTAPEAKEIMRRAVQQRTAYDQPINALIQQLEKTGTLTPAEFQQLQDQLERNPSPNDTTLFNKLQQTLKHLTDKGISNIATTYAVHAILFKLQFLVRINQKNGVIDPVASSEPPSNHINQVNAQLTRLFNLAGVQNQRVNVAVVENTNIFPAHPATMLRNSGEQTVDSNEDVLHGLLVSSRITAGNTSLNLIPIRATLPFRESFQAAIDRGARVVNVSLNVSPAADGWHIAQNDRAFIEANPNVLFVFALRNDRDTGDYDAYTAGLYGLANVLTVTNAADEVSILEDAQRGLGIANVAAIGTNVPVAKPNAEVGRSTGISFSTPEICQVVGLMWAANPALTVAQVVYIVKKTTAQNDGLRDVVDSGGVARKEDAVTVAVLTGLVRRGLSYADAIATLKLDTDTVARLKPIAVTIEADRSSTQANAWTVEYMRQKYRLTQEESAWLQNTISLTTSTSADKNTATGSTPDPALIASVLKKLKIQNISTLPALFARDRVQAVKRKQYNDVLAQMQDKFELTNVDLWVLKNIVVGNMSADRAMEKEGSTYAIDMLRYIFKIPRSTQSPHLEDHLKAIFTSSLAGYPSQTDAPVTQSTNTAEALPVNDSVVQPQQNAEEIAYQLPTAPVIPLSQAPAPAPTPNNDQAGSGLPTPGSGQTENPPPDKKLNNGSGGPPPPTDKKPSSGWVQRRDNHPERDAQDFVRKDLPLGDPLAKTRRSPRSPKADVPKGGFQLPAFPGATGADSSVFGAGRLISPKKSAEGLFNPQHTPPFPFDKEDGQNVPRSKSPKPHGSAPRGAVSPAPNAVALALSLLTQAPKGSAATLIQTWAQALSQRQATPGAEMLQKLLGSRLGLEQVLDYGYGGTVLQALSRVDTRLVQNYLNVKLLKTIAANTGRPALAKSATALLQGVARLASKRDQTPTPLDAAQTLAQLQQQLARLQRQITSGANHKAWQKNLHELQKNLQTFWVQIAPIIEAVSAGHYSQLAQLMRAVQHKADEFSQYAQDLQGLGRDAQTAGQVLLAGVGIALGFAWDAFTNIPVLKKGSI